MFQAGTAKTLRNLDRGAFNWEKAPQLTIVQLILAVFLPSAFAFTGFHAVLPVLVAAGLPVIVAWPMVAGLMLLVFVILAIILLHREAQALGISLWARMCMKKLSLKQWGIYIGIILVGLLVSQLAQRLVVPFMQTLGLKIPAYMPFFLNPTINPMTTDAAVLSPGLPLSGSFGLLPLIGITLFLNILTEELYFRAWMLPKLSRYGTWGWVLNGTFFALYHTFQIWMLPVLLVASLFFAFIFYSSKSIWPSFAAHLIGNFLFSILSIMLLIFR